MDEAAAAQVLSALAAAAPDAVLLWRGEGLGGSDVDVVVLAEGGAQVARVLRECGLAPAPQGPGRFLWRRLPGKDVVVDVLLEHAWPAMYPSLPGVLARAERGPLGLLVAAPGDRLRVHAAEAVAGWPWPRGTARIRALVEDTSGEALARVDEQDRALARLARRAVSGDISHPDRERLPLRDAARAATGSPYARQALRWRLWGEPVSRPPGTAPTGGALLVALSGMDGAGKSTAALALLERSEARGEPALVHWTRLARDLGVLVHVGRLARRLTGRSRPVSQPYRPEDAHDTTRTATAPTSSGGRRLVEGAWVVAVALSGVRNARRARGLQRSGVHVVCDRWLLDALVDLRIRYGHHPAAEWMLRRGFPRADVAVLLRVDPATAAARKPGDQRDDVLLTMGEHYDRLVTDLDVRVLDAGRASEQVVADLVRLVAEQSATRR